LNKQGLLHILTATIFFGLGGLLAYTFLTPGKLSNASRTQPQRQRPTPTKRQTPPAVRPKEGKQESPTRSKEQKVTAQKEQGKKAQVLYTIRSRKGAPLHRLYRTRWKKKPKYIFLVSIDGFAYSSLWDKRMDLPALRQLARAGVWGKSQTVFPSMTWPSHESIISGTYPRRHGILGNRWQRHFKIGIVPSIDNVQKLRQVKTLFDVARAKGDKVASLMWPGTQGSNIYYNLPEVYKEYLARIYTSRNMKRLLSRQLQFPLNRLASMLVSEGFHSDTLVSELTIRLMRLKKRKRPSLFLVHFLSVDTIQHRYGTSFYPLKWSLEHVDKQLERIIRACKKQGILRESAFFVVSDHGMATTKKALDMRQILIKAGISKFRSLPTRKIPRERVSSYWNGHAAFIYIHPPKSKSAPTSLSLKNKILYTLKQYPDIEKVYQPPEYHKLGLPTSAKDPGSPSLIALCNIHCYFRMNPRRMYVRDYPNRGMHGYLPNHPKMLVPFVGAGAGIKQSGLSRTLRNVDVAPTIAHLMGWKWPTPRDGKVLQDILK